jgi:acylphosphatase
MQPPRTPPGQDSGETPEPVALHITVSGRVQGVGFRYSCYAEARRLGLKGWVRNTPDGDVELWVESPSEEALEAMLQWLDQKGPPHARIDSLRYDRARPGGYRDFLIEPGHNTGM